MHVFSLVVACSPCTSYSDAKVEVPSRAHAATVGLIGRWDPSFSGVSSAALQGETIIQVTSSGRVILRDRSTLHPTAEVFTPSPATLVAARNGRALVALDDGSLGGIEDGRLVVIKQLPHAPAWIGIYGGVDVALVFDVVPPSGAGRYPTGSLVLYRGDAPPLALRLRNNVLDAPSGGSIVGDSLYVYWDRGEWGGELLRVQLSDGDVTFPGAEQQVPKRGLVPGFAPLHGVVASEGGLVAFGGTFHWNTTAVIQRVEDMSVVLLNPPWMLDPKSDPRMPDRPIHRVVDVNGVRWVVAFSEIWLTDRAFSSWRKLTTLEALQFDSGRPDAMGSYDPVVFATASGTGLLLGTLKNGFVSVDVSGAVVYDLGAPTVATHELQCEPIP